jgi:hypothetical protein
MRAIPANGPLQMSMGISQPLLPINPALSPGDDLRKRCEVDM